MIKRRFSIWMITLFIISGCSMSGQNTEGMPRMAGNLSQQSVAVEVESIQKGDLQVTKKIIGTVEPLFQMDVFPDTNETLATLYVEKGDQVEQGQLLATLNSIEYEQELSVEQASLENAKKQLESALLSKEQAEKEYEELKEEQLEAEADLDIKNLKLELEDAQKDLERQTALYEIKGITLQELEQAQLKEEQARIKYEQALQDNEDEYDKANIALKQAELSVEEAQLNIQKIENQLQEMQEDMAIYAPISGEVQDIYYDIGEKVSSQSPLLTIINTSQLQVEAAVTADYKKILEEGEKVQIETADEDRKTEGIVTYIAKSVNDQGLYDIEVELEDFELASGESVHIVFTDTLVSDQLLVPTSSILQKGDTNYIFIVNDGKAEKKDIDIVQMQSDWTAITGDIQEGDQLVIKGHKLLSDGMNVLLPGEELPVQEAPNSDGANEFDKGNRSSNMERQPTGEKTTSSTRGEQQ